MKVKVKGMVDIRYLVVAYEGYMDRGSISDKDKITSAIIKKRMEFT